jgi:cardiolipin synthase
VAAASGAVVSDRILTVPNLLSVVRLALVPVFLALLAAGRDGPAVLVLMASGVTDYLDGTLARRWGQVTRVGQLLDPVADRLSVLTTLAGLAWQDIIPWWLVAVLLARDGVLALAVALLGRRGYEPLQVHYLGKAATFNLLCAFPLVLLGVGDSAAAQVARPIGWAFVWWGTGLYWWSAVLYLRQAFGLLAAGRPPGPGRGAG